MDGTQKVTMSHNDNDSDPSRVTMSHNDNDNDPKGNHVVLLHASACGPCIQYQRRGHWAGTNMIRQASSASKAHRVQRGTLAQSRGVPTGRC